MILDIRLLGCYSDYINMGNMKYKITIDEGFFGSFTGQFIANSKEEAVKEAKDFYSLELDTDPDHIKILSVEQLQK